jgi:peptidoglycan/xylan/chitin deacetylase (PgdA/CDA1 family)
MSRRQLVASFFESIGATELMLSLRGRAAFPWLPILTFHRIRADHDDSFLFDECVVDSTPSDFERQMATVKRYFTPVGISDLLHYADGGDLPRNPVLISFDDGYRDNYDTALPILQKHGIKAMFFIATSYISERRMFWWDRINYLVKKTNRRAIELSYPQSLRFETHNQDARRATIRAILRLVKSRFALDLPRMLDDLTRATDVRWTDELDRSLADEHLMVWDHVRALRAAGMDVQSHTRAHRVLQTLPDAQLVGELSGSREDLERELDEPIEAISYPIGHRIADRSYIRKALQQAGYKMGFTNATGTHPLWRKFDCYNVNRIGVEGGTPEALFRAMLAVPRIFD